MTTERGLLRSGTLVRPGPIGRIVRLGLGILTAWPLSSLLLRVGPEWWITSEIGPAQTNAGTLIAIAVALWLINEIVNIGWARRWGNRPRLVVLGTAAVLAVAGVALTGSPWSPVLGALVYAWLVYTFAHLSISFFLAALLGTPGCEMRSIPHLVARLTGREHREHVCPGPLDPLDRWEAARRGGV